VIAANASTKSIATTITVSVNCSVENGFLRFTYT
jgi:hypothetical protein